MEKQATNDIRLNEAAKKRFWIGEKERETSSSDEKKKEKGPLNVLDDVETRAATRTGVKKKTFAALTTTGMLLMS